MARYVLSKDNDKIILTDTKTGKKRTLTLDDIDYVVDDNQKLRDENTISTYFRLKEEDFKPKTVTKKANLVQEYKEAKKYDKSDIDKTDPMLDFINKFKLNSIERTALAEMPYKETIKKFDRPEGEKNIMSNGFQRVIERIIEKGIKNTEEYIKNYLTKYNNENPIKFEDIFTVSSNYENTADYEKIKKYIDDGNHINNLEELHKQGIKVFKDIRLGCLNQLFINYENAQKKIEEITKTPGIEVTENINLQNNLWVFIYNITYKDVMTNKSLAFGAFTSIFAKPFIDDDTTLKTIYKNGLKFFDDINKINLLSEQIKKILNRVGTNKHTEIYNYYYQLGIFNGGNYTPVYPVRTFATKRIVPSYGPTTIDNFAKKLGMDSSNYHLFLTYNAFQKIYMDFLFPLPSELAAFGAGDDFSTDWTDKTLTRIDVIIDTLKGMGIGMGWSDRTLSRIDGICSTLNGMGLCSGEELSGTTTNKTISKIADIYTQLL